MPRERKFMRIAHMGASAYAPENTLKAIRRALEMDVDAVEVDVQRSKDGHLVVFHDLTLKRMTNISAFVKDLTLSKLKSIDIGDGEEIPTLDEVLQCIVEKGVDLFAELKIPGISEKVCQIIKKYDYLEKVIVDSFFHEEVYAIKDLCNEIRTGIDLYCMPIGALSLVKKANSDYVLIDHQNLLFYPGFPRYLRRNGVGVIAWIINERATLKKVIDMGVEGVMSDDPEIFRNL